MKARDFDAAFEAGDDIEKHLDFAKARRPNAKPDQEDEKEPEALTPRAKSD